MNLSEQHNPSCGSGSDHLNHTRHLEFFLWIQRVLILSIVMIGTVTAQPQSRNRDLRSKLERYLHQQSDPGYALSVFVSVEGKIVLNEGFGWIDSARTIHASAHTLYNIASMTKSFTSIAVYALATLGKLQITDRITKYFKDVPREKQSITIEQLLTHTSGLAQHYLADGVADRDSAVRRILHDTLRFHPGSDFTYADENYELLGAIVEETSQQTYETEIRSLVLNKARMDETRFWAEPVHLGSEDVAPMNRELMPSVRGRNWGYIGSGGMYSNVNDLHSWFDALLSDSLLDSASRREMWRVRWRTKGSGTGIASGWYSSSYRGNRELWTRGAEDWGHNGVLRWFPDRNALIIVLSNSGDRGDKNTTANRFISDGIADIILP